jgi:Tol biopolymer transport system component
LSLTLRALTTTFSRRNAMLTNRTFPLLALGLLALLAPADARAQSGPPSGIAFHSNRDGNNNIYVMDPDGSVQTRINTDSSNDQRADLSPDGRQIAFASNRAGGHFEVFVMNSDGSDVRQLTVTPAAATNTWPRWSPSGEWIAFQSNVSGAFQVYTIRPDGSDLAQITNAGVNQFPAWSPDGTRLAVRREVDIYVIDVTGASAPVRLTTTVAVGVINQMASWSPDGTQIAFMSTREPGNYPSVFVMNADGSGAVDLTLKPVGETGMWSSRAPAWSPNGKHIYFTGVRPNLTTEQIYVMDADGSNQTPLTLMGVNAEATVRHVRAPAITQITATPNILWPPNNNAVPVSVAVLVSDDSDPAPACRITGVTSNEPVGANVWQMTRPLALDLRAERFGQGSGRIYTLTVTCTNSSELSSTTTVAVTVPHDQRN